jgi:hypothetical protein
MQHPPMLLWIQRPYLLRYMHTLTNALVHTLTNEFTCMFMFTSSFYPTSCQAYARALQLHMQFETATHNQAHAHAQRYTHACMHDACTKVCMSQFSKVLIQLYGARSTGRIGVSLAALSAVRDVTFAKVCCSTQVTRACRSVPRHDWFVYVRCDGKTWLQIMFFLFLSISPSLFLSVFYSFASAMVLAPSSFFAVPSHQMGSRTRTANVRACTWKLLLPTIALY